MLRLRVWHIQRHSLRVHSINQEYYCLGFEPSQTQIKYRKRKFASNRLDYVILHHIFRGALWRCVGRFHTYVNVRCERNTIDLTHKSGHKLRRRFKIYFSVRHRRVSTWRCGHSIFAIAKSNKTTNDEVIDEKREKNKIKIRLQFFFFVWFLIYF